MARLEPSLPSWYGCTLTRLLFYWGYELNVSILLGLAKEDKLQTIPGRLKAPFARYL